MNTPETEPVRFLVFRRAFPAAELLGAVLRVLVTLAVLAGCTYLVFWRGESGWLYLPALIVARLAR
ncbi:hypothetical protein [Oleiharenicola sp. Vm1]|uniref:hypothetical protein n=1 Tax=Oleiharenicola sp. Vm1 TaxID=3398393 RepID=UPI0039F58FAD